MAKAKSVSVGRKLIDQVLAGFGVIATVTLLACGGVAWWAYSFTTSQVHDELASQQIFFPPKGSPALASSKIGPYLNQYAGQQLVNGEQAHTYANHFIAVHLSEIADGQTYAQVSNQALAHPADAKLQAQVATLFKGETLRGMLLNAYAFWTVGMIAQIAALIAFAAAGVMAILTLLGFWHMRRV
jgi:hypothetical protein